MAWLFQDTRQKQKLGAKNAPWYVGWKDHRGKAKKRKIGAKPHARAFKAKIESELSQFTYDETVSIPWDDFVREYQQRVLIQKRASTQESYGIAIEHFARIIAPSRVCDITTASLDEYAASRLQERGQKPGSKMSSATVNKELRSLRTVLNKADAWNYLGKSLKVPALREMKRLKDWVTQEHFLAIYSASPVAQRPVDLPYSAGDWWQSFITFAFLTGWRKGEILSLTWDDVDLEQCRSITLADSNKGGRDEWAPLHPVIVEHLQRIHNLTHRTVFPWPQDDRQLYDEFNRIQREAGIHLTCRRKHRHTEQCHYYGFHNLRYAFATLTAHKVDAKLLQTLMRHKSYQTTLRYIDMRPSLEDVTHSYDVPEMPPRKSSGKAD